MYTIFYICLCNKKQIEVNSVFKTSLLTTSEMSRLHSK